MIDIINDHLGAPPKSEGMDPHVIFLLDESGSMSGYRDEVVSTFNEYVQKVRKDAKSISLYTFDSRGVREKIYKEHPDRVRKLIHADYNPNAATPLYDAVGLVLKKFEFETYPCQFVGHTDGQENASQEWTKASLDEYIAKLSRKDHNPWLFTWLMEGLEGRQALHKFHGVKYAMSNSSRDMAMNAVATTTVNFSSSNDANPLAYTSSGTDTDDLDAEEVGEKDGLTTTTSGGTA